jgi:lipopolysaccharide export system protein LptA
MLQIRNRALFMFIAAIHLAVLSLNANSLTEDRKEKLHVTADTTIYNYHNGTNYFEGHVLIDQGTTHLTADKLTTKNNSKHQIEEAVAYGVKELAHFWTIPKQGEPIMNAHANVIKFYPMTLNVTLQGHVRVTQGGNNFQGQLIHYNMNDQTIIVPETKNGQAVLVYNPD